MPHPTPPTTSKGIPTGQSRVDTAIGVPGDSIKDATAARRSAKDSADTVPTRMDSHSTETAPQPTKVIVVRRSPRHHSSVKPPTLHTQKQQKLVKKKAFLLRQSLEGAWKEVDAETLDMSGDGSGWRMSGRSAEIVSDNGCLLYTSPSPRDGLLSRMPSSA